MENNGTAQIWIPDGANSDHANLDDIWHSLGPHKNILALKRESNDSIQRKCLGIFIVIIFHGVFDSIIFSFESKNVSSQFNFHCNYNPTKTDSI